MASTVEVRDGALEEGDCPLAYREAEGGAPTLVLVHGNSSNGGSFREQLTSPALARWRKVAVDLPGHGRSGRLSAQETYDVEALTSRLLRLVQHLRCERAVFVGHSLGGHLLLQLWPRLPLARGLVLFGTPPLGQGPTAGAGFLPHPAAGAFFKADLSEEEVEGWRRASFHRVVGPADLFRDEVRATDPRVRAGLGGALAAGAFADEVERVAAMSAPLLVLHGEHDALVSRDYLEALAAPSLWRRKVQLVPDAGHYPQRENPDAFNGILASFVESLG